MPTIWNADQESNAKRRGISLRYAGSYASSIDTQVALSGFGLLVQNVGSFKKGFPIIYRKDRSYRK